jgi:DNA-binding GntR family transcriptional regulator
VFSKNGIPLYHQLKEYLLKSIETEYQAGDLLPSEGEIEKKYQVSRITVRKAIEELARDGIVIKKQGKGTYVMDQKVLYDANIIGSLTQRLSKENRHLETRTIEYILLTDEHHVKEMLGCTKLLCIKRFRVLDENPFAIMHNYICADRVPDIEKRFTIESLYTLYREAYGIVFSQAEETVEARAATREQARLLEIEENAPLLSLQRLSFDRTARPIEFSDILIKSNMYKHKILLSS